MMAVRRGAALREELSAPPSPTDMGQESGPWMT